MPWLFFTVVGFASCSLDERTLEPKPTPGVGGTNGTSGTSSGKSGTGGSSQGGSSHSGGTGGTGSPDGGETSDGGDSSQGGNSGTGFGGSMAGAGNMAGSGGSAGNAGSAGSGGMGGATDIGDCADLNGNGVKDCDETLLQNSTFNSDTASWAASAGATQEWDALDARHRSGSGSIKVTNNNHASGAGMTASAAEQCVGVDGGKTYDIRARVFVDENESRGTPDLILWFYDSEDCSGDIRWTRVSGMPIERGAWQVIASLAAAPISPVPARSVRIRLAAQKAFNDPDFAVYFDDVLAKAVEAE